jgi:hypothetical protein
MLVLAAAAMVLPVHPRAAMAATTGLVTCLLQHVVSCLTQTRVGSYPLASLCLGAYASRTAVQASNHQPMQQLLQVVLMAQSAQVEALQAAKQQFLQQYGSGYGYSGWLEQQYQQEVGYRLGPGKHYLDYTGAALYPASLLEAVYKDLLTQTYGNPHSAAAPPAAALVNAGNSSSGNSSSNSNNSSRGAGGDGGPGAVATPPAAASEAVMEAAAAAVLEHLHADPADYQMVFTR